MVWVHTIGVNGHCVGTDTSMGSTRRERAQGKYCIHAADVCVGCQVSGAVAKMGSTGARA